MKDSIIREAIGVLTLKGFIRSEESAQRAQKVLEDAFEDRIFEVWSVEDVRDCAKQNGNRISKDKARDILATVEHQFDASIGINWDVISANL